MPRLNHNYKHKTIFWCFLWWYIKQDIKLAVKHIFHSFDENKMKYGKRTYIIISNSFQTTYQKKENVFYMSIIKIESSVCLILTRKTFKFHKDNPNLLFSHFMFIILFSAIWQLYYSALINLFLESRIITKVIVWFAWNY